MIAERPQLAAAVREQVPSRLSLVRWLSPSSLEAEWARIRPWPWVVVGTGPVPEALLREGRLRPLVVSWLGTAGELAPGWSRHPGWASLSAWLHRLGRRRVLGLRLAPYRGVRLPGGAELVPAEALESLIAAHPLGLAPDPALGRAVALLASHRFACRLATRGGLVRLAAGVRR